MLHGWLRVSLLLKDCEECRMAPSKRRASRDSITRVGLPYEIELAMRDHTGGGIVKARTVYIEKTPHWEEVC